MRRIAQWLSSWAVGMLVVGIAVGCRQTTEEDTGPPFQGVTVRVSCSTEQLEQYVARHSADWTVQSGGRCVVVSAEESADVYVGPLSGLGSLASRVLFAELPEAVYEPDPEAPRDWPEAVRDHLWYWGPTRCVLPISVRTYVLVVRQGTIDDDTRAKLDEITWNELDELLQQLPGDGPKLMVRDPATALLLRAATYGRAPESFAFFFDPWQERILVNTAPFLRAAEEWQGVAERVVFGTSEDFAKADIPLGLFATDQLWPILAQVEVFPIPGSQQYYDHSAGSWRTAAELHRVSFFDGLVMVVDDATEVRDAALSLVTHLGSPQATLEAAADPLTPHGPFRLSHFRHTGVWLEAGWPEEQLSGYFKVVREMLGNRVAVEALQVRAAGRFMDGFAAAAMEIWQQGTPAQERLDQLQAQWKALANEVGFEAVAEDYRRSVGLLKLVEP